MPHLTEVSVKPGTAQRDAIRHAESGWPGYEHAEPVLISYQIGFTSWISFDTSLCGPKVYLMAGKFAPKYIRLKLLNLRIPSDYEPHLPYAGTQLAVNEYGITQRRARQ